VNLCAPVSVSRGNLQSSAHANMVSVTENLAAKLDGHNNFLTVVPELSAWPKLEPGEAARIIMQNLYKIYAFDMDSVAVAVSPKI
jgi:hypothetical protein